MSDFVVIDIETTGDLPWLGELVAVGIGKRVLRPDPGRSAAAMLLARSATVVAHTNYDLRWLMLAGVRLGPQVEYHDTKVMAWMLDGTQPLDLASLSAKYLDAYPPKPIRVVGGRVMFECSLGLVPIEDVPWPEMEAYNLSDLEHEARLYEELRLQLKRDGLWDYFVREEAPFSRLLIEMEVAGVPYDSAAGGAMLESESAARDQLRERLVAETGIPGFNPGSGDQVAAYLYGDEIEQEVAIELPKLAGLSRAARAAIVDALTPEGVTITRVGRSYAYGTMVGKGLKLKPVKSNKKNEAKSRPTVAAKKLKAAHGKVPWVRDYCDLQKRTKLIGYLADWQDREHEGRLHGRLDQSGTSTGRLSAREPNMQQVTGRVRELFAGDLVIGDYGGLEARLAAHFSMDPVMLDIFRSGKDLYGVMAAHAWGGPEDKSNPGRGLMKTVWLGSQYGAQGETLANTLSEAGMKGYSGRKADALLADLEAAVPRLFEWRQEVIELARLNGYTETLSGRRRHLPDLESADWKRMSKAERQAVSTKVQGSAADVCRKAMLKCREWFNPSQLLMLLQVHDEIMWERGPLFEPWHVDKLREVCESVYDLEVPLVFEVGVAQSWGEKGDSNSEAMAAAAAALEG